MTEDERGAMEAAEVALSILVEDGVVPDGTAKRALDGLRGALIIKGSLVDRTDEAKAADMVLRVSRRVAVVGHDRELIPYKIKSVDGYPVGAWRVKTSNGSKDLRFFRRVGDRWEFAYWMASGLEWTS